MLLSIYRSGVYQQAYIISSRYLWFLFEQDIGETKRMNEQGKQSNNEHERPAVGG